MATGTQTNRAEEILENIRAECEDISAGMTAIGEGLSELTKLGYLQTVRGSLPELTKTKHQFGNFILAMALSLMLEKLNPTPLSDEHAALVDIARSGDAAALVAAVEAAGMDPGDRLREKAGR